MSVAQQSPLTDVTAKRTLKPGEKPFGIARLLAFAALAIMAVIWLFPIVWALATALKTETDAAAGDLSLIGESGISFDAFAAVLAEGNVYIWAWNSLWTSAVITLITVAISAMAAYAFSRLKFRGRSALFFIVIASIIAVSYTHLTLPTTPYV